MMTDAHQHLATLPTEDPTLPRRTGDFPTMIAALEYAAKGQRGFNFYDARGDLTEVLTFQNLMIGSQEIGRKISASSIDRGDRVALIAETSSDFLNFFFGCQYAGALPTPLPLPTTFGQREGYVAQLALQMKSCGASAVICPHYMKSLVTEAAKKVKTVTFCGTSEEFVESVDGEGDLFEPTPKDVAYLQYSSGSTRFPHGIIVTHRSLMANCHGISTHGVQLRDGDRCVSWLPFYHDMGLVGTVLACVSSQVTTDYIATEDFARRPLTWLTLISRNKGTVSYSPTFGYDICTRRVSENMLKDLDLSSWRGAGIGADMIQPDVMTAFAKRFKKAGYRETSFVPSYGLAECTLAVSFMPLETGIVTDLVDERILSGELTFEELGAEKKKKRRRYNNGAPMRKVVNCGKPLPEFEVDIKDPAGAILPDKEIGRIFVRGPSVMQGYFDDPKATKEVLSKDGWLDTGDMGYMLKGCIYIVGRVKDLIIINGKNHWPQDIEWAVEQIAGVRSGDAAAISVPGEAKEEVPLVLVQCRFSDDEDRRKLIEQAKKTVQQIAGVKCRIELVPPRTLPRTSSGKLSRAKTRAKFLSGELPSYPR